MPRSKVKLAFIENLNERKASYKKREKGFLKKAYELSTLCDVEMAIVIYSPFRTENEVFPNNDAAMNTFTKFIELPEMETSKNKVAQKKFTEQRIKKIEDKLRKVRKENRIIEYTNKMHDMLNSKDIPIGMHPYDLNDLSYVINQKLKQVCEAINIKVDGEGSTSNASQPILRSMVPGGGSIYEGPRDPQLDPNGAPESIDSLLASLTVSGGSYFEGPWDPQLGAPELMDPLSASLNVPGGTYFEGPRDPQLGAPESTVPLSASLTVPGGTYFEGPRDPQLDPKGAPELMDPLLASLTVPSGTYFEGPRDPQLDPKGAPELMDPLLADLMESDVSPISMTHLEPSLFAPLASPAQVSQPMFHPMDPLGTPPQSVHLFDPSQVPLPSSFSSQIFSPVIPQTFSPIPPPIMDSPIPSPVMAPPMSPSLFPETNPFMNIHSMGASVPPLNNYQNYSVGFPQSPALSEMLNWNDDIMTLLDDPSFSNMNIQDPNHNNTNL